jgi:hypothetical protein
MMALQSGEREDVIALIPVRQRAFSAKISLKPFIGVRERLQIVVSGCLELLSDW